MTNIADVRVKDKMLVAGRFIEVVGIHHINDHPFQLYQLFFEELLAPLCFSSEFDVEIVRFGTN